MVGFMARQGGHHEAQKSTSTGSLAWSTSFFQLNSCSSIDVLASINALVGLRTEGSRTLHQHVSDSELDQTTPATHAVRHMAGRASAGNVLSNCCCRCISSRVKMPRI